MEHQEMRGRRALVVGLGKSGVAAAKLLAREGCDVAVADGKPEAELIPQLLELQGIVRESFLGGLREEAFAGRELVVVSPGVPLSLPVLQEAKRHAELVGEVELASRYIDEPIIGITGTNGKSTTTALTAHLLASAGRRVFAGGNLGTPLSQRVLDGGPLDVSVCELSSYQLESTVFMRCHAATVLNVTPDHLDRYPSMEAYATAKERIFESQREGDLAVLNAADPRVRAMRTRRGVERALFDPRHPSPERGDASGKVAAATAIRTGPRMLEVHGQSYALHAPTLRGAHNAENALAAILLARHLGANAKAIQRALSSYPGLPHRLELVLVKDGVEWLNDSKATNVDSVEKSLSAFEASGARVILILGGRGKGAPYAPLRLLFAGRVKALLTIGEDAPRIGDELGDLAPLHPCGTLAAAVEKARTLARKGDAVLLSPACASYDQFKNFEDRGAQFQRLARGLA